MASRSAIPAELELTSTDARRLGVGIDRIVLSHDGLRVEIAHDSPTLRDGFYEGEDVRRWTDGMARLPPAFLAHFTDGLAIEIHRVDAKLRYPKHAAAPAPNRAAASPPPAIDTLGRVGRP